MNEKQFGLCLCCGAPWLPSLENMIQKNCKSSMALLYFEHETRNCKELQEMLTATKQPHFCQTSHKAHMIHQSHHAHAVKSAIEKMCTNNRIKSFECTMNPTGKNPRKYQASWDKGLRRVDLTVLYQFIMHETRFSITNEPPEMSHQYNMTVDTCVDCNMCMTMRFWYRYHLYTNIKTNPERLIPSNAISITHPPSRIKNLYPKDEFKSEDDYFTAYLAYYLQACLPDRLTKPDNKMPPKVFTLARQVYIKLCWVVLQTTCLICEYKLGAENSGKLNQNPKSILGAIELYLSYFGWVIACFQDCQMQHMLNFNTWHQLYFWDITYTQPLVKCKELLALSIIPIEYTKKSSLLIQQVGENMLLCFKKYMLPINNMLMRKFDMPKEILYNYVCFNEWELIRRLGTCNTFDELVQYVGIRPLWLRVMQLSIHTPPSLLKRMKTFLYSMEEAEISNVCKRNLITDLMAYKLYKKKLMNPFAKDVYRGVWACVLDLLFIKAIGTSV